MKYIILPILKFIWALILWITNKIVSPLFKFLWTIAVTVVYTIFYIPIKLIEIVWTLKIKFRPYKFTPFMSDVFHAYQAGVYYKLERCQNNCCYEYKEYTFKSYYHYIWNIK